jgi:hypothetical protein
MKKTSDRRSISGIGTPEVERRRLFVQPRGRVLDRLRHGHQLDVGVDVIFLDMIMILGISAAMAFLHRYGNDRQPGRGAPGKARCPSESKPILRGQIYHLRPIQQSVALASSPTVSGHVPVPGVKQVKPPLLNDLRAIQHASPNGTGGRWSGGVTRAAGTSSHSSGPSSQPEPSLVRLRTKTS